MNLILSFLLIFASRAPMVCGSPSFFSAVNLEEKPEMVCVPNATFHIDCNRCTCGSNGMSMNCTDWTCETLGIYFDQLINVSVICQPGELLLVEGLKCVCSRLGGRAICSSARLELANDLQLRQTSSQTTSDESEKRTERDRRIRRSRAQVHLAKLTTRECSAPGMIYRPRDRLCDTCICPNGNNAGSEPACLGTTICPERNQLKPHLTSASRICSNACESSRDRIQIRSTEVMCVPRSTFSVNCNQCSCGEDGLSMFCDQYPCLDVEVRNDQILSIEFRCEAGGEFVYNRHLCTCLSSGVRAVCTLLDPILDEDQQHDQPGTGNNSEEFIEAKNGTVLSLAEFPELCTPGTIFRQGCNICLCGKKQWAACTSLDCRLLYSRVKVDDSTLRSDAGDDDHSNAVSDRTISSEAIDAAPAVFKEDMWMLRTRSLNFCRQNQRSQYCRYLRNFWSATYAR
ncbi:hypothetical protein QAD02_003950 [Eretmocerus hayati]|uniref:Uncharacterized protein n=1 Tax=Eretmocerus hayati TaxID=131215 RepID=A0ACC2NT23_9HYME|nr:hypothetical protein QAD02_003950 [Eretmocerus hayati]